MTVRTWEQIYDERRPLHGRLADMIAVLLRQQLDAEEVNYLSITHRVKDRSSFLQKIERKGYDDPGAQMMDFAGVRVVTYLPSQVEQVCDIVSDFFEVDAKNSSDKTADLGTDKVGYQSRHFVCTLGSRRSKLPEYKDLHGVRFEIQVRTILQHAWADLAHGRAYKNFAGGLPPELERSLNLHAGTLELIDSGLNELAKSIDNYSETISKSDKALLAEEINSISLASYIIDRFPHLRDKGETGSETAVKEIKAFGLKTISDFDKLLTSKLKDQIESQILPTNTLIGTVRKILMVSDLHKFFSDCGVTWEAMTRQTYNILVDAYGEEKVAAELKKRGIPVEGS
jgi:putative GTP pyrophosphokinase